MNSCLQSKCLSKANLIDAYIRDLGIVDTELSTCKELYADIYILKAISELVLKLSEYEQRQLSLSEEALRKWEELRNRLEDYEERPSLEYIFYCVKTLIIPLTSNLKYI